jgi:hypothetical protein
MPAEFAMRPEAVRQAVHRVWRRLDSVAADGRFADMAALPVLVEHGRRAR